ncbi:MAG: hypothetical protein CUN55_21065, partial [Phototrophicales bacterium]
KRCYMAVSIVIFLVLYNWIRRMMMLVDFTKPVRKSELLHRVICKDSLVTLPPHASIFEATQLMADKDCGAVGIVDRGRFIGLLTERDIISDVIAKGRNPKKVKVSTVM